MFAGYIYDNNGIIIGKYTYQLKKECIPNIITKCELKNISYIERIKDIF